MFFHSFKIDKNFKETIKTEIFNLKKNWKKDLNNVKALSSGFFPNYLFFDILKEQISNKLFYCTTEKFKASCWWANFCNIGHHTDIHSHEPENISSIILIKTDNTNPLYFDLNPGILQVKEEEGLVLLFDSKIKHGVKVCENERITLAIDFIIDI